MNGTAIVNLAGLVVVGVIVANFVANPGGTKAVGDGIGAIWKTSVNGLLGKPS